MSRARLRPDWPAAYQQAARELGMPARGAAGSMQNKVRQTLGPRVAARAREILERGELLRTASDE